MTIKPCANTSKMTAGNTMIVSRPLVCLRPCIGGLGWRDMVEGKRQVQKGPHLLQPPLPPPPPCSPPCSLTPAFRTQRLGRDFRAVFLGQLHNHCFAVTGVGGGVGRGLRVGWGGGGGQNMQCNAMQYFFSLGKWHKVKIHAIAF